MKFTLWPVSMLPMSASETAASICMLRRSFAMMKRVGALRLAATVLPTSTWREITVPSIGE